MSTSQNQRDDTLVPPNKSSVILLLSTIGDTAWRMFIPTISLTIVGVIGDHRFQTKPWFTTLGIVIGSALAALLVYKQLKKVKND